MILKCLCIIATTKTNNSEATKTNNSKTVTILGEKTCWILNFLYFCFEKNNCMAEGYPIEEPKIPKVSESLVPRVCSLKEVQRRSMTLDQFTDKLYAMVDAFYKAKGSLYY